MSWLAFGAGGHVGEPLLPDDRVGGPTLSRHPLVYAFELLGFRPRHPEWFVTHLLLRRSSASAVVLVPLKC
jgi:hypothetical protein